MRKDGEPEGMGVVGEISGEGVWRECVGAVKGGYGVGWWWWCVCRGGGGGGTIYIYTTQASARVQYQMGRQAIRWLCV